MCVNNLSSIVELTSTKIFNTEDPLNAIITSIHWGMVPWGIVLALDVPENESTSSPHYRIFLVFENTYKYLLPLVQVDTIVGLIVDFFVSKKIDNTFTSYTFDVLKNNLNNSAEGAKLQLEIIAMNVRCFQSCRSKSPFSGNWLSFRELQEIVSDISFLEFYERNELGKE